MKTRTVQIQLYNTIDFLVKYGNEVKSGTWQANKDFSNEIMLVQRNLQMDVPCGDGLDLNKIWADQPWAEDHFNERVGGIPTNPGETYKYWPYANFKEGDDPYQDGKVFSHTYQERFWPRISKIFQYQLEPPKFGSELVKPKGIRYKYGDLQDVINQLKENPLTRQAYLPIFFPEDTGAVHKQRVPCTLGYYFWIENNKLYMNYIIRSCDALRHFRNDVYLTIRLLQYVAEKLNIGLGDTTFYIFNFHVFKNDLYALNKREKKICQELTIG